MVIASKAGTQPIGTIGNMWEAVAATLPAAFRLVRNAKAVAQQLFPGARITDWRRDPKSRLGRANPRSFHNQTGAAVDIAPVPGMTFDQMADRFRAAGYNVHPDSRDEVTNPSGHATGPHWHFVLGER